MLDAGNLFSSKYGKELKVGKYQLDYKGMQQVEKFHEKNSTSKSDKKARVNQLKSQFLKKSKKKSSN